MPDKTISIPFNSQSYLKKQKAVWGLILGAVVGSYIIYSIVTLIVLGTGISIDRKGGLPLISLLGIVMLITILLKYRTLYTTRKSFYTKARYIAHQYQQDAIIQTYTLTDDVLLYHDQYREIKLSWTVFEPVTTLKNIILLRTKYDDQLILSLSNDDVDAETYKEVLGILTEKTGISE